MPHPVTLTAIPVGFEAEVFTGQMPCPIVVVVVIAQQLFS